MSLSIADRALLGPIYKQNESKLILDSINEAFFRNISQSTSYENFYSALSNSETGIERVKEFWKYFEWTIPEKISVNDFKKSPTVSTQLRERGNKYYKDHQFDKALRAYTLAIMFAPPESIELCVSYGNRSAIFLETKNQESCGGDIMLALSYPNCPEELRLKLTSRLKKSKDIDIEDSVPGPEILEYRDNHVFKPQTQTSSGPLVRVVEDAERGRELVTNVDAKPGTVMLVETPYITVLKVELNWDISHCHFCLNKTSCSYPCSKCVFTVYCSENCRTKAFNQYHQYECQCLPMFHLLASPRYAILAFRIICKLGPENAYKLYKSDPPTATTSNEEINAYQQIFNLVSHAESHHDDIEKFSNLMQAMILYNCLHKFSNFFHNYQSDQNFAIWITSRLLHHLENIPYNSISLDEISGPRQPISPETIRKMELAQFATGVYANISLLNHACNPNVTRFNTTEGKSSIIALRSIASGQPLFTSYTKSFLTESTDERQEYLKSTYNFICKCQPCIENWPKLETLMGVKMPKLISSNKKAFDSNCKSFYDAYQKVLENRPIEAIERIRPVITYFQASTQEPFGKTYMAQDILKRALDLVVYL